MGVKGEADVIDKQGVAATGLFDLVNEGRRQSVHDLIMRPEARLEAARSPLAPIERQFVERRPRYVETKNVERRMKLGDGVGAEIEQEGCARLCRSTVDVLSVDP